VLRYKTVCPAANTTAQRILVFNCGVLRKPEELLEAFLHLAPALQFHHVLFATNDTRVAGGADQKNLTMDQGEFTRHVDLCLEAWAQHGPAVTHGQACAVKKFEFMDDCVDYIAGLPAASAGENGFDLASPACVPVRLVPRHGCSPPMHPATASSSFAATQIYW